MKYTTRFDLDVASTIAFKHLYVNGNKCGRLGYLLTESGNKVPGKFVAYYDGCNGVPYIVTKEKLLDLARTNGIKYVSKGVSKNGVMTAYIVPNA